MDLYIYDIATGIFTYKDTGAPGHAVDDMPEGYDFTLTPPPDMLNPWEWVVDKWVAVEPPAAPIEERRAQAWEAIKAERLRQISAGVYIPSIDKWLHTDELSAIQYAQIGYTISAGLFVPLVWKTVSGDFVQMTEALYNELQVRMVANTQANYARAEYHKIMMEASPDPLAYDFSQGWTGPAQTTIDKAQTP